MSAQLLARRLLTAETLQEIDANQAMILGERRHIPVWAALEALIVDYEDLQLGHDQVNIPIQDVWKEADSLADRMLKFDWEDTKWQYQVTVAQQINSLRQDLDNLTSWPRKTKYLVGSSSLHLCATLTKESSCSTLNGMIKACTPSLSTLGSGKGEQRWLPRMIQNAKYFSNLSRSRPLGPRYGGFLIRGIHHSVDRYLLFSSFSERNVNFLGPYLAYKKARIGGCGCATALEFGQTGQEKTVIGLQSPSRPLHSSSARLTTKRERQSSWSVAFPIGFCHSVHMA